MRVIQFTGRDAVARNYGCAMFMGQQGFMVCAGNTSVVYLMMMKSFEEIFNNNKPYFFVSNVTKNTS